MVHAELKEFEWEPGFELFKYSGVIFVVKRFTCLFGEHGDIFIDFFTLHLQFVKFSCSAV